MFGFDKRRKKREEEEEHCRRCQQDMSDFLIMQAATMPIVMDTTDTSSCCEPSCDCTPSDCSCDSSCDCSSCGD
jgi:hypothetical protein